MKLIRSNAFDEALPLQGEGPVYLAIGMFDGVHVGHQAVLESCIQTARGNGGTAGVLTFFPHPSRLFRPEDPVKLLQPPAFKYWGLERLGLDFLIEQSFDRAFSQIRAEEFPDRLMEVIPRLKAVYVGKNWRFGHGRAGSVEDLVTWLQVLGVAVISLPRVEFNGVPISSTWIRSLLIEGEMEAANQLLGSPYFVRETVVPGAGKGRTIGFPTLNFPWSPEIHPRYGVYTVRVTRPATGETWPGIANFGLRPTVETRKEPLLEVHLLPKSNSNNLPTPGDNLQVEFLRFLRPEKKFTSLEELKAQIALDVLKG